MTTTEDAAVAVGDTRLDGRVALVTGAAGNIGSTMIRALAAAGADVAVAYRSDREAAEQIAADSRAAGRRAIAVQADLSDPGDVERLVDTVVENLGAVDILVANAGTGVARSWEQVGAAEFDEALAVNLRAPYLMARRALPKMIERSWGRILFVSSLAAWVGGPFGPDYSASKAALHGLTHYFAGQVARHGVTVNVLAPALVGEHSVAMMDEETARAYTAAIPVGRLGTTDELAAFAVSILENGYLTNKVLTIDGGMLPR
ncbi:MULTISPECIES: SDR family NAD(P)-dependent oxidoreductase [unclassified Mycobacterium]|uniref:SDR family NAD(P)-dependent oxidoreductase n=1 Tax=unclassified Mycobacterium TaxID=2642494 RepID=UPI0029C8F7E7|nr:MULTISPECIES: SDR family NAD(P)-dependent oxidoreductase [unclassified Mycobacterium]